MPSVAGCPAGDLSPGTARPDAHCYTPMVPLSCRDPVPPPAHHQLASHSSLPNTPRPDAAKQANCMWPNPSSHLRQVWLQGPADDWALPPGCLWQAFSHLGTWPKGPNSRNTYQKTWRRVHAVVKACPVCHSGGHVPVPGCSGSAGGGRGRGSELHRRSACMESRLLQPAPSRE